MNAEWIDMELGQFIELKRGYDLPKLNRKKGTIPLVSSSGEIDFHDEAKVKGPGVITGRYGTIGKVFYIESDFWPLNTTLYVKDFKGNDPLFVYYFLKTLAYSDYSDKAAVPGINRNHLHKAKIRVPLKPRHQRNIAMKLWCIDKKIELNQRTGQTLEEIAQAMFKSWFIDFDPTRAKIAAKEEWENTRGNKTKSERAKVLFIERAAIRAISGKSDFELDQLDKKEIDQLKLTAALFSDDLKDSPLGKIPNGWRVSEIGNEVTVVGGGTPNTQETELWENGYIHWTSPRDMSNLTDKILIDTYKKITAKGLATISSGLLPVNTVLMSSRAPVGYLAITKIPVAINQGYIAMKCQTDLTPEYVVQWAESIMDEIKQRASGTTFAEINKKNFRLIPVIVPEPKVIQAFSLITSNIYEKITESLKEIKYLSELRDSLLPKLLSGEMELGA